MTRLQVRDATIGYSDRPVCADVTVQIPDEELTVIIGPNACGKSAMLKSLTRLLSPSSGHVLLDGEQLHRMPTRQVAQQVGLLPRAPWLSTACGWPIWSPAAATRTRACSVPGPRRTSWPSRRP